MDRFRITYCATEQLNIFYITVPGVNAKRLLRNELVHTLTILCCLNFIPLPTTFLMDSVRTVDPIKDGMNHKIIKLIKQRLL